MKSIESLVQALLQAKEAYYNNDPVMSDAAFDAMEEELRELDPENPYFGIVGTAVTGDRKIRHDRPMLSMQKAKTAADIGKWMEKLSLPEGTRYTAEPKIDGLSASCRYENGRLAWIATRGDGETGQDISHVAKPIGIPQTINLPGTVDIRGELYLPKDTPFDTGGRPLRNNCVGLINRKENQEDLRHVHFVAYQLDGADITSEQEKIAAIGALGFRTFQCFSFTALTELEEIYRRYLDEYRSAWEFETDGLIVIVDDTGLHEEIDSRWVVDHHHHYSIALKPPAESRETTLTDIIWQISRQGNAIPVAVFSTITIGGANINRASLSNADTVRAMALCRGDRLLIERANDVIPYVREKLGGITGESDLLITHCPSCASPLARRGVHLSCENPECPETNIQKILYWVVRSGVENVAEATIRTLYTAGKVRRIADLYALTEQSFEDLPGFADKKTSQILTQLAAKRSMSAEDFIGSLGIPLVQKKTLRKLGITSLDAFRRFSDTTYIVGQNIIEWKSDPGNIALLDELASILTITEEQSAEGIRVCMTGKGPLGRKELAQIIESRGYVFTDDLTKDTGILLCEDPASGSSKIKKAEKYGVRIMSYEEFLNG